MQGIKKWFTLFEADVVKERFTEPAIVNVSFERWIVQ